MSLLLAPCLPAVVVKQASKTLNAKPLAVSEFQREVLVTDCDALEQFLTSMASADATVVNDFLAKRGFSIPYLLFLLVTWP